MEKAGYRAIALSILSFFFFFTFSETFSLKYGVPFGTSDMLNTHYPDIQNVAAGNWAISYSKPGLSYLVGGAYRLAGPAQAYISLPSFVNAFVCALLFLIVPALVFLWAGELGVYFWLVGSGITFNFLWASIWAQLLFMPLFLLFFLTESNFKRALLVAVSFFVHAQGFLFLAALLAVSVFLNIFGKTQYIRKFAPVAAGLAYNPALNDACAKFPRLLNWACAWPYFFLVFNPAFLFLGAIVALFEKRDLLFWAAVVFSVFGLYFDLRAYLMLCVLLFAPLAGLVELVIKKWGFWAKAGLFAYFAIFYLFSWSLLLSRANAIFL